MSNTESGRRNVIIGVAIAVVIVIAVGIGWAVQANRDSSGDKGAVPGESTSQSPTDGASTPTAPPASPPTSSEGENPDLKVALVDKFGIGVGNPDAPAKVEIFEDFQCPHCKDFEDAASSVLTDAAAQGKAFVVYRPMAFINDYSVKALNAVGVVLDSGNGEAALALHDALFANQPQAGDGMPADDWFVEQAVAAGADRAAVESGILDQSFGQWVTNATDAASKRGVNSTPTVLVNGEVISGSSIDEIVTNTVAAIAAS